jgi:hypothetical protein
MTGLDPGTVARQCAGALDGMKVLREFEVPQGTDPEHAQDIHAALLAVRAKLDLAEELIREIRALRRRARLFAVRAKEHADDKFDERLVRLGEGAVRQEWQGGREREAQARMLTLDERRAARSAERLRVTADDTFDQLTASFFGLLNVREELIARLRALQFETVMER